MASDVQMVGANPALPGPSVPTTTAAEHGFTFRNFLSAINPLQYFPVMGTIYRAVTGDVIPEAVRQTGSMLVSGLLGGPIGLVINIAMTIVEKVTGIDPEQIVTAQLNPSSPAVAPPVAVVAAPPVAVVAAPPVAVVAAPPVAAATIQLPLTKAQLAAYGVSTTVSGTLKLGTIEGADVLNAIQLAGLTRTAVAAYGANQPALPRVAAQGS